jgi:putative two-component system response regulator
MARVLLAEDDPDMRDLVVEALRKDGHDVQQAASGGDLVVHLAEAFRLDRSFASIDVVISDVRMPGCSGLEIVEKLFDAFADPKGTDGDENAWRRVPLILMTAFGDEDTRRRARRIGAILFDKPLSLAELRAAVMQITRR